MHLILANKTVHHFMKAVMNLISHAEGPNDGFIIWYNLLKVSSSAHNMAYSRRLLKKSTIYKIRHKNIIYILNSQRLFSEDFCMIAII